MNKIIVTNQVIKYFLYCLVSSDKENTNENKRMAKGVRFNDNCKIEDGGPSIKQIKQIPPKAVLNTIVCPKFEEL